MIKWLTVILCLTSFVRASFEHNKVHKSLTSFLEMSSRVQHEGAQKRFLRGFFHERCQSVEDLDRVKIEIISHIKKAWFYYNWFLVAGASEEVIHNHLERHSFFNGDHKVRKVCCAFHRSLLFLECYDISFLDVVGYDNCGQDDLTSSLVKSLAYNGIVRGGAITDVASSCKICEQARAERLQREKQECEKHQKWIRAAPLMALSIADIISLSEGEGEETSSLRLYGSHVESGDKSDISE